MEVRAVCKYVRMSPYKIRRVADLIRGKGVEEAEAILNLRIGKAPSILKKVLQSAVYNARQKGDVNLSNFYIKKLLVDQGPFMKRIRPMARRRAGLIRKRFAHITLILDERV
jgi:large subunit ribosomal protein L22